MTSREIRRIRRDTGYILQSNEVSTRSLRIAQRNARKRKANVSQNDNDLVNKANTPSKVNPKRNVVSRQSLESIGKKMRKQPVVKDASISNLRESSQAPSKCDSLSDEQPKTQGEMLHTRTLHDSNDIVNDYTNSNESENNTCSSNSSNVMNESINIDLETIIDDMSNMDTDKRNNASSSSRIAKLNAIECMKQLLLPPLPKELNQSKSDRPNSLHSTENPVNNMIHVRNTNENRSINNDSTSLDIDNASFNSFGTTNDTNLSINGELFNANKKCNKLRSIDDVITFFNLPKSTKAKLPSLFALSEKNFKSTDPKKYLYLISTCMKCINVLIDTLCPGPNKKDVLESLANMKPFMKKNIDNIPTLVGRNRKTSSITDTELLKSMVQCCFELMKQSPKGSLQRRVIRAVLVQSISKTSILRDLAVYCKHPRIDAGTSYTQAKFDYDVMQNGSELCKAEFSRKSVKDSIVEDAVSFILDKDNIATVSWGYTDCVLSQTETVVLPQITRRTSCKVLWERYNESCFESTNQILKRSTFYEVLRMLTKSDQMVLSSVDYVQSLLVTDTIENLQFMIEDLVDDDIEKAVLEEYLSSLSIFLKYGYAHHCTILNDNCTTHDLNFILGNPLRKNSTETATQPKITITCTECKFPFYVINQIKCCITRSGDLDIDEPKIEEALTVLDDSLDRFCMYMGHKARCSNQSQSIRNIEEGLKDKCSKSKGDKVEALLIMDFKMKFNPMSSRESTIDHYGKRGISWHGFGLIYYLYDEVEHKPVRYCNYLDQILSDGNKQDAYCVMSLLDAALAQISHDCPFISSVVVQSDNARCYENHFLILGMCILNDLYHPDIFISSFIHTETQDGKTLLDAHFARCMRFLSHFMKTWKQNKITRINTPRGLGFALGWNGGMSNVMIQVVQTDTTYVSSIESKLEPVIKQLKKYFGRVNQIYFNEPKKKSNEYRKEQLDAGIDSIKNMSFEIGVQLFSNIDRILRFSINVGNNAVTPDDQTLSEIQSSLRGNEYLDDAPRINEDCPSPVPDNTLDYDIECSTNNDGVTSIINDFTVLNVQDSDDESDYEPESDSDLDETSNDWNVTQIEKRVYGTPDQTLYSKDKFVTKVNIEKMVELDGCVTKGHNFSRRDKRKRLKLRNVHREDVVARAVRHAHVMLMTGDSTVRNVNKSDPILQDASVFDIPSSEKLQKGWGRRCTLAEGGTYGRKYITKYKDDIQKLYDEGKKHSSHKMNPAMMREYLVDKYPSTYTLPGETEIKQQISAFVQNEKNTKTSKKYTKTNLPQDWTNLLEEIVQNDKLGTPENLYIRFMEQYQSNDNCDQTSGQPDKAIIKRKISSLKSKYKNIALHAIL